MPIAIIPARGGSKRIPRKNIREFCGMPMIAWSIKAAKESQCFDHIIVSTDDKEIASVAETYGASVPFLRPRTLADDYTATAPVIAHAINWLLGENVHVDDVCCIYATAPFIRSSDIRRGLERLRESGCDYTFPVAGFAYPIQRALRIKTDGCVAMFHPEEFASRSQDLEEAFHDAGQFYWGRTEVWLEDRPAFSANSVPIRLPRHQVQDIDTQEDWERAELMFRAMSLVGSRG